MNLARTSAVLVAAFACCASCSSDGAPPEPRAADAPALTGRVVDGDDRPVASAHVLALEMQRLDGTAVSWPPTTACTDADGRFTVGFPAGLDEHDRAAWIVALEVSDAPFDDAALRGESKGGTPALITRSGFVEVKLVLRADGEGSR
ncbi:MAG: hypothetical protein R3F34_11040 [Planctomycetota bacterium]